MELQRDRERLHAGLGASERFVKTLSGEMEEMAAQLERDAAARDVARAREVEREATRRADAHGAAEAKMERVLALKLRENTAWQAARLDQRTVSEQRLLVANLVASRARVRSLALALDALEEPRQGEGGGGEAKE